MNVFVLDESPQKASIYHIDKHVVKQILESAQMLSTAVRLNNAGDHPVYKIAYAKHPCTIKCTTNRANYRWVLDLMICLSKEFEHRFEKTHKSSKLIEYLSEMTCTIPEGVIEYAQAMPDEHKNNCAVTAYRNYYRSCKMFNKNGAPMGFWTKREKPEWL